MTWWCSAQGIPWAWTWRPYPGVWLLVIGLVTAYGVGLRRAVRPQGAHVPKTRWISFVCGIVALWIALDWPIGTLGGGYLVSIHMVQYLLLALAAPALMLHGMPPEVLRAVAMGRWVRPVTRLLTRPLVAFVVFNGIMLATHLPTVVDALQPTQLGSFAMDMLWVFSGLIFWWPVLSPLPELGALSYPGRLVFLVMNIFIPTVPAAFLTFADYPIYSVYELAPPIGHLTAVTDQQIAGVMMKVVGGFIIFGTASVLFFRWFAREEAAEAIPPSGERSAVTVRSPR